MKMLWFISAHWCFQKKYWLRIAFVVVWYTSIYCVECAKSRNEQGMGVSTRGLPSLVQADVLGLFSKYVCCYICPACQRRKVNEMSYFYPPSNWAVTLLRKVQLYRRLYKFTFEQINGSVKLRIVAESWSSQFHKTSSAVTIPFKLDNLKLIIISLAILLLINGSLGL